MIYSVSNRRKTLLESRLLNDLKMPVMRSLFIAEKIAIKTSEVF